MAKSRESVGGAGESPEGESSAGTGAGARGGFGREIRRDAVLALMIGLIVALVEIVATEVREADREDRAERVENLRFVRSTSAGGSDLRRYSQLDLTGAPLSGLALGAADFSGAMLREANLDGTDLSGATLDGADLSEARLVDALLEGVSARCVEFDDEVGSVCADFSEALMRGADLRLRRGGHRVARRFQPAGLGALSALRAAGNGDRVA